MQPDQKRKLWDAIWQLDDSLTENRSGDYTRLRIDCLMLLRIVAQILRDMPED